MSDALAARTSANQITRIADELATKAQPLSEDLARFAENVDRGIACGDMPQIASGVPASPLQRVS
ncbi:hypothetical protein [Streptomyces parvus]|uniref:hypothetical protein n=1 Tax=Streptomyces parvus TaxID=66428 RepID=UPI00210131BF|nr:hypothetical protein [Streptomyces parvus]MCQ1579312.1 hypothetical protein [Streptomyces parvus]